jgi:hypothetical protein
MINPTYSGMAHQLAKYPDFREASELLYLMKEIVFQINMISDDGFKIFLEAFDIIGRKSLSAERLAEYPEQGKEYRISRQFLIDTWNNCIFSETKLE